ncbi:MAG: RtcB family protein [Clostridium sp.]
MIEIIGKYTKAKVFTDNIEQEAISQIYNLCNQSFTEGCSVCIMPDCHAGAGCVIGFTANLGDKVIPNIVGVDIGCGMLTVELGNIELNLQEIDETIRKYIPSGVSTHERIKRKFHRIEELKCYRELKDMKRIERSVGTLGGGNHFIEIDCDNNLNKYLIIHSGSRNLGKQVAEYYQKLAIDMCKGMEEYYSNKEKIIEEYKKKGKRKDIQEVLKKLKSKYDGISPKFPKELCFLTGKYREDYLHDMKICQEYASENRKTMAEIILQKSFNSSLLEFKSFETIHNYINFEDNIIRKGSISAKKGERLLIPINMRDGSILCYGKGNEEWNNSAPHGAGRIMSRSRAREVVDIEEYEKSMEGIFTSSVNYRTIDEAPMVYKPMEEILNNIHETVEDIKVIKPIYNFKAN